MRLAAESMAKKNPLSTPISNGQVVEIMTDILASPNPDWLSFVNTQKARRAIQHILRSQDYEEQIAVGEEALNRAFKLFNGSVQQLSNEDWEFLLNWRHLGSKNALFEQIAVGDLLPQLVANKLFIHTSHHGSSSGFFSYPNHIGHPDRRHRRG